jgi:hypothetical protein
MSEKSDLIRIDEIPLTLDEEESVLMSKIAKILGIDKKKILGFSIVKRAVDSRNRSAILLVYSVEVKIEGASNFLSRLPKSVGRNVKRHRIRLQAPYVYEIKSVSPGKIKKRPIVVGSGPSGLFCALLLAKAGCSPLVIERGKNMDERIKDVESFLSGGIFDPKSNIQFGEGGAGTFSDGKLNTLINDPRIKYVFEEFISAGAPEEIRWISYPHIGTDKLRGVVKNLSRQIIELGGEILFNSCLTDIAVKNNKISSAIINGKDEILTDDLILAIGHSSRDTYEMLHKRNLKIEQKTFSMGVRIEHKAEMINKAQYNGFYNNPKLPPARYQLVARTCDNRPVYTFCMCPGGYVMAATSEDKMVVTNGMSEYAQDGENSNSALLVNVYPDDFSSDHPLAGIEFQRKWERKAFIAGGKNFKAPAQLVGDFLDNKESKHGGSIEPTYRPGVKWGKLDNCLPEYVIKSLRESFPILNNKINGFSHPDAVLTGVETRSTAPVRLTRDDSFQTSIRGIYSAGEGAGYAGGIVSSAVDGLRVAEAIVAKYH